MTHTLREIAKQQKEVTSRGTLNIFTNIFLRKQNEMGHFAYKIRN